MGILYAGPHTQLADCGSVEGIIAYGAISCSMHPTVEVMSVLHS